MKIKLYLLIIIVIGQIELSYGQNIFKVVEENTVGNFIKNISNEVNKMLGDATTRADYLLEKNLTMLNLMINNLQKNLSSDLDKKIKNIKGATKEAIYDIGEVAGNLLKATKNDFLKSEEFLKIDIFEILNKIPLIRKNYFISSIDGIGQSFRNSGEYSLTIMGSAFNFEDSILFSINGKLLGSNEVVPGRSSATISFPANYVNGSFKNTEVNRVPFTVRSFRKKKRKGAYKEIYSYNGKLLLLPKLPVVKYRLIISNTEDRWAKEETESQVFEKEIPRAVGDKQWSEGFITAQIPTGVLLLKNTIDVHPDNNLAWTVIDRNYKYDLAANTITVRVRHQWDSRTVKFYLSYKYKMPIKSAEKDTTVFLENATGRKYKSGLPFGTHFFKLSNRYGFFILEVTMFNGEVITFTPNDPEKSGISVKVKESSGDNKRLVVEIKKQI